MMTPEQLDLERAAVLIGIYGETQDPFDPDSYTISDWAPEWVTDIPCDHDQCVTILRSGFTTATVPDGYYLAYSFNVGEQSCPWCGDGTGEESKRAECKLCDGDGLIYWGCDWGGYVFAPRYAVTQGLRGCYLPNDACYFDSAKDARGYVAELIERARWNDETVKVLVPGERWAIDDHDGIALDDLAPDP